MIELARSGLVALISIMLTTSLGKPDNVLASDIATRSVVPSINALVSKIPVISNSIDSILRISPKSISNCSANFIPMIAFPVSFSLKAVPNLIYEGETTSP